MRTRIISTVLLCTATAAALAACGPEGTASSKPPISTDPPAASTPAAPTTSPPSIPTDKKTMPKFVGMGLQSAQDAAQAEGFYILTSHDALGRDRMQAFDRNWKVCSQSIAAGKKVPATTELNFGSVKLDETCPVKDAQAPKAASGKMPDFAGKSVKAARAALDSGTSLAVKDASAEDRFVLMESNWQVCSQAPAAGAALSGQPVEFKAVKFGESCP